MEEQITAKLHLKNALFILTVTCFWFPDNLSGVKYTLFKVYSIFMRMVVLYPYLMMEVINAYIVFDDLEAFAEGSYVLFTVILELVKAHLVIIKGKNLREFVDELDKDPLNPRTIKEKQLFSDSYNQTKIIFWSLLSMYDLTVVFWTLFPFFDGKEYSLPMSAWYPFTINSTLTYQLTYIHQVVVTGLYATMDAALDALGIFLIGLISLRIDVLLARIEGGYKGYLLDCGKNDNMENKKKFLEEIATQHELIIQYVQKITQILKYVVVPQFVVGCVIICITMFQASVIKPFTMKFGSIFIYQACMLTQLFLYSWYGNELSDKYSKITQAAYFSDWYEMGSGYCRTLQIIMMRATIPLTVTGGYFFTLSLNNFTSIIRSSWSFFALLRQAHAEN